ncbi:MAG: bile acid:sodium symporter family protein [Nevskiaceae bacterium]|nr:MAG: bile acid:sodium symporter family protein [Nevskiaceae bacterium]TBR73743.1 MAG: bile acid:sodium symporter family protein [Nevskiaceae bacterium]
MPALARLSRFVGRTFALWVLVFAALAYAQPQWFAGIAPHVGVLLGVIMFGMGLTLTPADFKAVARVPKSVLIGVVAHYAIMPSLAFVLAVAFRLPPDLAVGVILVGCCPSGTASNVMTYLARGNVALSVAVSTLSTVLAPILTPLLVLAAASQWLDIHAGAMFLSILEIVLLPVVAGVVLRVAFPRQVARSVNVLPLVSVAAIVVVIAAVVAVNHATLRQGSALILLVVMLHNLLGFGIGFIAARVLRLPFADQQAITFEVGMQNSGLGAALALAYFAPVAAVPSAIFSVWHNLSGSALATYWAKRGRPTGGTSPGSAP